MANPNAHNAMLLTKIPYIFAMVFWRKTTPRRLKKSSVINSRERTLKSVIHLPPFPKIIEFLCCPILEQPTVPPARNRFLAHRRPGVGRQFSESFPDSPLQCLH